MKVFLPAWNGDFRLEGDQNDEDKSILLVEKATAAEKQFLAAFFAVAVKKKWIDAQTAKFVSNSSDYEAHLTAPLATTSKMLIKLARPKKQTLTAVKFSNGKIETAQGTDSREFDDLVKKIGVSNLSNSDSKGGALSEPKPQAAVSVKRPTICCPQCVPGSVERASEVLLSFLNEEEHRQWANYRAIVVRGGKSGHRYRLAHRGSELAQKQSKICYDLDDRAILHFYDWSVPPEEEVLASKLILEHHEDWLRNEASYGAYGGRLFYKNPFGSAMDGTDSTSFMSSLGAVLKALLA